MKPVSVYLALSLALPAGAQIKNLEVNQAIGKQFKGAMNFVAGKATVVRAYLEKAEPVDPAQTSLLIERNGQRVAQLAPRYYEDAVSIVEFLCPSREECGNWADGDYVFTARVNGSSFSTEGTRLRFQTRQALRIMAVPVQGNYSGKVVSVEGNRWKKAVDFVKATYPVAAESIEWDIKDELDASAGAYDLDSEAGRQNVWQALTDLMPQHCAANRQAPGCYDLIVGFVEQRPDNGNLQGYTYGAPSNVVVASDADMEATVVHEIAHIYGAGDTYEGGSLNCPVNPAPDGYSGKDFNDPDKSTVCTEGKRAFPTASATLIPVAEARAYEVGGRGALGDYACFMGTGGKPSDFWISPEVYDRLFNELDPERFKAPQRKGAGATERLLIFSGFLSQAGALRKEPWFTLMSSEPTANTQGDYTLRVLDAAGGTIASARLDAKFSVNSNPPRKLENAPFEGAVRMPDTTAKLAILDKAGKTLWESAVAKSDPQVTNITVGGGRGEQRITWNAHQADAPNAKLTYVVEYNHNTADPNSDWEVLAAGVDRPEWTEDFDALPGGPAAKLRIWATDGIRSGQAESTAFHVPVKEPLVFIDDTPARIKRGTDLALSALVEDLQDDAVPDARIVWTSSIAGRLGTGTDIVVKGLAAGTHVIALSATNSFGVSASERITVRVE